MRLVADASLLILLASAGHLELLPGLAQEVLVSQQVLAEIEAGESRDRAAEKIGAAPWATVTEPSPSLPEVSAWNLGTGETAVLSLVAADPGTTAVIDDRAARRCAGALELPFVGTLGIVLAAKDAGLVAEARPILEAILRAGYYLAGEVLERALRTRGELPP